MKNFFKVLITSALTAAAFMNSIGYAAEITGAGDVIYNNGNTVEEINENVTSDGITEDSDTNKIIINKDTIFTTAFYKALATEGVSFLVDEGQDENWYNVQDTLRTEYRDINYKVCDNPDDAVYIVGEKVCLNLGSSEDAKRFFKNLYKVASDNNGCMIGSGHPLSAIYIGRITMSIGFEFFKEGDEYLSAIGVVCSYCIKPVNELKITKLDLFRTDFVCSTLPDGAYIDSELSEKYGCFNRKGLLKTSQKTLLLNGLDVDYKTTDGDLYIHCDDDKTTAECTANIIEALKKYNLKRMTVADFNAGTTSNKFYGIVSVPKSENGTIGNGDTEDALVYIEVTSGVEHEEIKPTDIAVHITLITDK